MTLYVNSDVWPSAHPGKHHRALWDGAERDAGAVQASQELEEGGVCGRGQDGAQELHIWIHKNTTVTAGAQSVRLTAEDILHVCVHVCSYTSMYPTCVPSSSHPHTHTQTHICSSIIVRTLADIMQSWAPTPTFSLWP